MYTFLLCGYCYGYDENKENIQVNVQVKIKKNIQVRWNASCRDSYNETGSL